MGSRRKACISARHTVAWMSDESSSCRLRFRFAHLITLMYLTFRRMTREDRIHVQSQEMREVRTLIMPVVLTLRSLLYSRLTNGLCCYGFYVFQSVVRF